MGEKFGRYDILSTLGSGGMGMVYLAQDPMLSRQVALKVLDKAFSGDDAATKRFLHEARISAALNHPNITSVYDLGVTELGSYIAMEYLTGESLRSIIDRKTRLDLWKKILIALQIAKALEHAHRSSVIHRDIKPSNIQVLPDGVVKILDFGIAKKISADPTVMGRPIGTPGYSSPEQIREQPVSPASDIFSFGAVLYELLTSRPAFPGQDFTLLLYKIVYDPFDPFRPEDDVPEELQNMVEKAMQKKPEERYASFTPIVQELRTLFRQYKPDLPEDSPFNLNREDGSLKKMPQKGQLKRSSNSKPQSQSGSLKKNSAASPGKQANSPQKKNSKKASMGSKRSTLIALILMVIGAVVVVAALILIALIG